MARGKDGRAAKKATKKSGSTSGPGEQVQEEQVEVAPRPDRQRNYGQESKERVPFTTTLEMLLKIFIVLGSLPLISISIQLALQPLYGSGPVMLQYRNISLFAAVVSGFLPDPSTKSKLFPDENTLTGYIAFLAALSPQALYQIACWTTPYGPKIGPIITQLVVTFPLLCLSVHSLRHFITRSVSNPPPFIMATPIIAWNFLQGIEPAAWNYVPIGGPVNSTSMFTAVAGIFILLSIFTPNPNSSIISRFVGHGMTVVVATMVVAIGIYSTIMPRGFPIYSSDGSVSLLASEEGKFGLVSVAENRTDSFRYLRAGHSLIGGVWINEKALLPETDANPHSLLSPTRLGDSVYAAFTTQEGVRMFKRPPQTGGNSKEKALIIGLGAGITPRALNEHGVDVTILEIDQLVYNYAHDYFGLHRLDLSLQGNGTGKDGEIWIQDARQWVADEVDKRGYTYDFIVHDVFSGGSVPAHLFAMQFWVQLKRLMKPGGVLAVNFAGFLGSPASRSVQITLNEAFADGICRAYHDDIEAPFKPTDEFINIVFFCTTQPELTVRQPKKEDYLGSPLRRAILSKLEQRVVPFEVIQGNLSDGALKGGTEDDYILKDEKNRLGEWQGDTTIEHWKVMRSVLSGAAWELY